MKYKLWWSFWRSWTVILMYSFSYKRSFRQYIAEWDSSTAGGMPCLIKACMTLEVLFTDGSRRLRCCFRDLGKSTRQGTLYQGLAWKCSLLSHVQLFCNMMDCSPPGSSVHEIFQARILEWVAISSARGSSWPRDPAGSPVSPVLQVDSLPAKPRGKPCNTVYF